MQSERERK